MGILQQPVRLSKAELRPVYFSEALRGLSQQINIVILQQVCQGLELWGV